MIINELKGRQHAASGHFRIDYLLHRAYKAFYIRSDSMNNADAWQWATGGIEFSLGPRYGADKMTKLYKLLVEKLGVTGIEWLAI
ncbi:DUF6555 family protein [Pseudomonas sp. JUb42]|uniref:DUF6555 family protein n=1 Tax=Pseudomonas sp. JUb42 TaxID=2940611 RepID=UPI00286DDBB8|nr:DUF6555 family protein [Pseudomonas sp. JUb42]